MPVSSCDLSYQCESSMQTSRVAQCLHSYPAGHPLSLVRHESTDDRERECLKMQTCWQQRERIYACEVEAAVGDGGACPVADPASGGGAATTS